MKNIITLITLTISPLFFGQIIFGGDQLTNNSVSIEFGSEQKGLILPWILSSEVNNPAQGSLLFDSRDRRIKYFNGSYWIDLSINSGIADLSIQNDLEEKAQAKVTVGTPTTTDGILVLEDTNKAMVLPKVISPASTIVNPSAGMMAYDPEKKILALYNGNVWTYWKAPTN